MHPPRVAVAPHHALIDQQPLPRPIDLPGEEPDPAEVWSDTEIMTALPLMRGTPIEVVWLTTVGGGLRKEKARALYWRDLEFADVLDMNGRGRASVSCA